MEDVGLSPIRRQYLELKRRQPDAILLFRLGDFYETFEDDAALAARVLDITLTSREMGRGERVPMAGIPAHAAAAYIARLIAAGHRRRHRRAGRHGQPQRHRPARDRARADAGHAARERPADRLAQQFPAEPGHRRRRVRAGLRRRQHRRAAGHQRLRAATRASYWPPSWCASGRPRSCSARTSSASTVCCRPGAVTTRRGPELFAPLAATRSGGALLRRRARGQRPDRSPAGDARAGRPAGLRRRGAPGCHAHPAAPAAVRHRRHDGPRSGNST